jgi:hypothetical protein
MPTHFKGHYTTRAMAHSRASGSGHLRKASNGYGRRIFGRSLSIFPCPTAAHSADLGKSVRSMAGLRCRSRLVACCWACRIGRPSVYLFLFHSDDGRFDGSGGYTGVGRGGNAVAESQLSASHDRVGSLAGIIESIRTLLSAARIEANISPRRLPIAELIARCSLIGMWARPAKSDSSSSSAGAAKQ